MNQLLVFLVILLCFQAKAGILKTNNKSDSEIDAILTSTTMPTTPQQDVTLSTTTVTETAEEGKHLTPKLVLSRDEQATIQLSAKNPLSVAFRHLPDAEVFNPKPDKKQQTAKLLLLSTQKIDEKTRKPESEIEEVEEESSEDLITVTTVTPEAYAEEATTSTACSTKTDEADKALSNKIQAANSEQHEAVLLENVAVMRLNPVNAAIPVTPLQESAQLRVNNAGTAVFEVKPSERDCFDDHQHLEQRVHFEPLIQSVEIVPSRVDDALIEDYARAW